MNRTLSSRLTATVLAGLLVFGPSPIFAQDSELIEPSEAQQEYNNQGVTLIQDGKFKEAIASFRSSLSLGELNITYLNLGRAYFRLDRCLEARRAYDEVKKAPQVKSPAPTDIETILQKFESEYTETCSGTIALSCEGNPQVSVDDEPAIACAEVSAWPVKPGKHTVTARYDAGEVVEEVDVAARAAAAVTFEEPEPADVADPVASPTPATPPPAIAADDGSNLWAWLTLGAGGLLIGTAFAIDLLFTGAALDDLDSQALFESKDGSAADEADALRDDVDMGQTLTWIFAGAGAAAVITSGVLFLLGGDEGDAGGVSAVASGDGAAIIWHGRF